jgi:hypothetical protein
MQRLNPFVVFFGILTTVCILNRHIDYPATLFYSRGGENRVGSSYRASKTATNYDNLGLDTLPRNKLGLRRLSRSNSQLHSNCICDQSLAEPAQIDSPPTVSFASNRECELVLIARFAECTWLSLLRRIICSSKGGNAKSSKINRSNGCQYRTSSYLS